MSPSSRIKLSIANKIKNSKAYATKFFRRRTQTEIAMSIRGLREKRDNMRQVDLAKHSDMKQSAISRIEQAEYSSWSLTTLFRVAEALGARLRVIFEPIEDVVKQYEEKEKAAEIDHQEHLKVHLAITTNELFYSERVNAFTAKEVKINLQDAVNQ